MIFLAIALLIAAFPVPVPLPVRLIFITPFIVLAIITHFGDSDESNRPDDT